MTSFDKHSPGTFCWIELATSDAESARKFYTTLFDWTTVDHDMGEMGLYTIFQKGGRDTGAMYAKPPEMAEVPPHWLSYVAVESADDAVARAKELGASVQAGPFDVFENGRMAVITDPGGASFAVWQPNEHQGVGRRDEPNTLCWIELQARDLQGSKKFYTSLFGWRAKESPEYIEWHIGENAIGGMMLSQAPPGVPAFWLPYFAVSDADATAAKATSLGGGVHVPPMDVPNVGRFAVLIDGQGAAFAVIRLIGT